MCKGPGRARSMVYSNTERERRSQMCRNQGKHEERNEGLDRYHLKNVLLAIFLFFILIEIL